MSQRSRGACSEAYGELFFQLVFKSNSKMMSFSGLRGLGLAAGEWAAGQRRGPLVLLAKTPHVRRTGAGE